MALKACFEGIPGVAGAPYMALANMSWSRGDTLRVLEFLQRSAATDEAFEQDALALVGVADWPSNLVGAVASLFARAPDKLIAGLWRRIENGSWVSAQMACVLERIDPLFVSHARESWDRLEREGIGEPEPPTAGAYARRGPESASASAQRTIGALKVLITHREGQEARIPPHGPGMSEQRSGWGTAWMWRAVLMEYLDGMKTTHAT